MFTQNIEHGSDKCNSFLIKYKLRHSLCISFANVLRMSRKARALLDIKRAAEKVTGES